MWTELHNPLMGEPVPRVRKIRALKLPKLKLRNFNEKWRAFRCEGLILRIFWAEFKNLSRAGRLALLKKYADFVLRPRIRASLYAYRTRFNRNKRPKWYRSPCRVCGSRPVIVHHIVQLQHGGGLRSANRISICRTCHADIHPWLKAGVSLNKLAA